MILTDFPPPKFDEIDLDDPYFQQDGAPPHVSRQNIDTLRAKFDDSLNGPDKWQPILCDLTPLYYFLWGYVRLNVYANQPATFKEHEGNIQHIIAEMLHRVIGNWRKRVEICKRRRHFVHIINNIKLSS